MLLLNNSGFVWWHYWALWPVLFVLGVELTGGFIKLAEAKADGCPVTGCQPVWVEYNMEDSDLESPEVVNNTNNLVLEFSCISNHQLTEWVFDWAGFDREGGVPADRNRETGFATYSLEVQRYDISKRYSHELDFNFGKGLSFEETFLCRSVANHSDNVLLRLEPNVSTGQIHIKKTYGVATRRIVPDERRSSSNSCREHLPITQIDDTYFVRCERSHKFRIHVCSSHSSCANRYRGIKQAPHCVSVLQNVSKEDLDLSWARMVPEPGFESGVLICQLENGDNDELGAWDFFFTGTRQGETPKLHFSLSEIDMRDLIWVDPAPQNGTQYEYVTQDTLETRCFVSQYAFAYAFNVSVTLNGSTIFDLPPKPHWNWSSSDEPNAFVSRPIAIHFAKYGPGYYEIHCGSRICNKAEFVTRATAIDVQLGTQPYFESYMDRVVLEEGEQGRRLSCDALGVPKPDVVWGQISLPGIRVDLDGHELVLDDVSTSWNNFAPIKCTGTSRLGTATKEFHLHVHEKNGTTLERGSPPPPRAESAEAESALSATTTVVLMIGLLCAALLAFGIFYLYFRFNKIRKTIVSHLTTDEVDAFVRGKPNDNGTVGSSVSATHERDQCLPVECFPYNSHFEVPENEMFVDFKTELGSGHYGIVYKGQVRTTPVAVKTVRPNVPIEYFKALMSELKILAHIGSHEHIVNLVGANSSNIKNRQLYVGVELCKVSLLKHLRDNQAAGNVSGYVTPGGYQIEQETSFSEYANQEAGIGLTAASLVRWTAEIATAMEFLAEKRIVHGDLAARNVLLSFNMRAKICDFGLSRQMVDYSYVKSQSKSQQCGLPWKWMAPESLSHMHFSTKSDVWAFGVTCWEMFSYGSVPYACTQWTLEFVGQLSKGLRLPKPDYANDVIYAKMMECWCQDRQGRPSFTDLKYFFAQLAIAGGD